MINDDCVIDFEDNHCNFVLSKRNILIYYKSWKQNTTKVQKR